MIAFHQPSFLRQDESNVSSEVQETFNRLDELLATMVNP
jgi:hypothetical protein